MRMKYIWYFSCNWNFTEICSKLQLTHRVTSREKLQIDGKFTKLKSWWCARWEIIPNCGVKRALWLSLISLPSCCINASTDEPSPHSQMCIWSIINKIKQSPPATKVRFLDVKLLHTKPSLIRFLVQGDTSEIFGRIHRKGQSINQSNFCKLKIEYLLIFSTPRSPTHLIR